MKLFKTTLLSLVALLLTSCWGTEPPTNTIQYGYASTRNYSYVTNSDNATADVFNGANYVWKYDLTAGICTVNVSDVRLAADKDPIEFVIENVKYAQNKYFGIVIDVPRAEYKDLVITEFKCISYDRTIGYGSGTTSYYDISYVINGKYRVRAITQKSLMDGPMLITNTAGQKVEEQNKTSYAYTLNFEKNTVDFTIYNLNVNSILYNEMTFKNLPFSISDYGINVVLDKTITPVNIGDKPIDVPADDLRINISYTPSINVSFRSGELLYNGSATIEFNLGTENDNK